MRSPHARLHYAVSVSLVTVGIIVILIGAAVGFAAMASVPLATIPLALTIGLVGLAVAILGAVLGR